MAGDPGSLATPKWFTAIMVAVLCSIISLAVYTWPETRREPECPAPQCSTCTCACAPEVTQR